MAERGSRRTGRRLAAIAAVALALGGCAETGQPQQISLTSARSLMQGPLTQTVVPAIDGFSSVTVTVGTYEVVQPDAVLRLEVRGAGVERRAFVNARTFDRDPDNATFRFEPVPGSAGERFELTFSLDGPQDVALFYNRHDPYADGELSPVGGDLRFLIGHADRTAGTRAALGLVADETAGNLRSDPWFTRLWASTIVALTAGLVLSVRRERSGRDDLS